MFDRISNPNIHLNTSTYGQLREFRLYETCFYLYMKSEFKKNIGEPTVDRVQSCDSKTMREKKVRH